MIEKNPIQNDIRKALRNRQLGKDASCVLCSEQNAEALRRCKRTLVEKHHLAGRANDTKLTVLVCANCHLQLTEDQRDHGVALERQAERTKLEKLEALLRGLALFLYCLAERLFTWAEDLTALIRGLDRELPRWRELPEAH